MNDFRQNNFIIAGVGADDTFILSRVWAQKKHDTVTNSPSTTPNLENLVCSTMQHALVSMLVTSVTTTAAFFSSYISSITAIKCFRYFIILLSAMKWNNCTSLNKFTDEKMTHLFHYKMCMTYFD